MKLKPMIPIRVFPNEEFREIIIGIHSSDDTKKNQDYLVSSNIDFINKMRKELLSFSKGDK